MKKNCIRVWLSAALITAAPTAFAQVDDSAGEVSEEAGAADTTESTESDVTADTEVTSEGGEEEIIGLSGDLEEITGDEDGFIPEPGLEQFVSVSTKITQTVEETPASVFVIGREQIRRAGWRSVGEALTSVPGLYVSYDLINYHVGVRGIFGGSRSGSRTLKVMINGRPVSFVQSGTYVLGPEFIPVEAIERIEVMRGPASALYGAGALEGAINIVTWRPAYEGKLTTTGVFSGYGSGLGQTGVGGAGALSIVSEKSFLLLAANYAYEDRSGLSLPDDSNFINDPRYMDTSGNPLESDNDTAKPASIFGQYEGAVGNGRLSVRGLAQLHDRSAEFHDLTLFSGDTRIQQGNFFLGAAYEKPFASSYTLRVAADLTHGRPLSNDQFVITPTTPRGLNPGLDRVYDRDFKSTMGAGAVELIRELSKGGYILVGADLSYQAEQIQQVDVFDLAGTLIDSRARPASESLTNGAGYAQALYPVTEKVTLAAGLRVDGNSVYGAALSARAGAVFHPAEKLYLKLLAGRAFKAPSPQQLWGAPIEDGDFAGDEDLPPQYINGVEAVADVFLTTAFKAQLSAYYNYHQNSLSNLLRGGQLVATAFDASTIGGEAMIQHAKKTETLDTDFAVMLGLQDTKVNETEISGVVEKPVPDNEIFPRFMAGINGSVRFAPAKSRLRASFRHIGKRVPSQSNLAASGQVDLAGTPNYTLGSYNILDLALSSDAFKLQDRTTIQGLLRIDNLLDEQYAEIGFNGVDVPNLGRVAWIQARINY